MGTGPSDSKQSWLQETAIEAGEFSAVMANLVGMLYAPVETGKLMAEEGLSDVVGAATGVVSGPMLSVAGDSRKTIHANPGLLASMYLDQAIGMETSDEFEVAVSEVPDGYEQAEQTAVHPDEDVGMFLKIPTGDVVYHDMEPVPVPEAKSDSDEAVPTNLKVGALNKNQLGDPEPQAILVFERAWEISEDLTLDVEQRQVWERGTDFEIEELSITQSDTDSLSKPLEVSIDNAQLSNENKDSKDIVDTGMPAYPFRVRVEPNAQEKPFHVSLENPETFARILADRSSSSLPRSVEFILDPPGLGKITVFLSSKGEQVSVKFVASSHSAHQVLVNSQNDLGQALSQKGLSLAGFFVDHGMAGQSNESRRDFQSSRQTVHRNSKVPVYEGIRSESMSSQIEIGSHILDYRV